MVVAGELAEAGLMSVALAAFDIGADAPVELAAAHAVLSDEERARSARFHFARDRDRFVRCRGLVRWMLAPQLGIAASRIAIGTALNGKPFLLDAPIEFNVSHSGDVAVVATSRDGPVGIDIERIDRMVDIHGLGQSVFSATECLVLAGLSDAARRRRRFFEFWTAKEARMKLTGEGMSLAPRHIVLRFGRGIPCGIDTPSEPRTLLAYPALPFEDVVCCLATAKPARIGPALL